MLKKSKKCMRGGSKRPNTRMSRKNVQNRRPAKVKMANKHSKGKPNYVSINELYNRPNTHFEPGNITSKNCADIANQIISSYKNKKPLKEIMPLITLFVACVGSLPKSSDFLEAPNIEGEGLRLNNPVRGVNL